MLTDEFIMQNTTKTVFITRRLVQPTKAGELREIDTCGFRITIKKKRLL